MKNLAIHILQWIAIAACGVVLIGSQFVTFGTPSAPQPGPSSTYTQVVRVTYTTNFYNVTNVWTPPLYLPSLVVTGTLYATKIVTSKIVTNTP